MSTITQSDFKFPNQTKVYKGKVRDVYSIGENLLVMVVSDRISAFDHVLPKGIPFKGQVLNQIASHFLAQTKDIVPNWIIASPDPVVSVGEKCEPFKVEMVIRGYLAGHAAREYASGKREVCGVKLPDGLKENDKLPTPIITPTTKASVGHDEDISKEEILKRGIVSKKDYEKLEDYTRKVYLRGTELAAKRGLILVDTKYEFGKDSKGVIRLIDEIHTPDSSRYFYLEGYEDRQKRGEKQKQLSKEFVREWLMANGFQGKDGQKMPAMPDDFVTQVSERYIELYELITGNKFQKADVSSVLERVEKNVTEWLDANVGIR